jgi:hypothetical protein
VRGPDILVRSLSVPTIPGDHGSIWQYHGRSDRHSKIACWGIVFDLMSVCPLLRRHISEGKVFFGINHEMRDFQQNRKKNLDLVLCTPSSSGRTPQETFATKIRDYRIVLDTAEQANLSSLPELVRAPVGSVLVALEAKACMTAHQKALPRLYDELNSSHLTVHGATDEAIAAAFVMINGAASFISPTGTSTGPNIHRQPRATEIVRAKVTELPRRSSTGRAGFDAIAITVVECRNDGSPVSLVEDERAPRSGDAFHYETMILRLAQLYATRFALI